MISDKMVDWLDNNIDLKYALLWSDEFPSPNWKQRFQDLTDRQLMTMIGEDRMMFEIIGKLSKRAFEAGQKIIAEHIAGFKDNAEYGKFVEEFEKLQAGEIDEITCKRRAKL